MDASTAGTGAGAPGWTPDAFLQHLATQHNAGEGEQDMRQLLQFELAALAQGLGAEHLQTDDSSSTGAHASSSVTDLLAALTAQHQQQQQHPHQQQHQHQHQQQQQVLVTSAGHQPVLSTPLALSLGAAGELPLLQVSHSGGMQAVLPVTSLAMPSSSPGGTVTSIQPLQTLQLVQLPNGQLRALQSAELQALLQQQQQHQHQHEEQQQQQHYMMQGDPANGLDIAALQQQQQQQQQQQDDQPPAKRQRTDAGLAVLSEEDAAAELAGLHQAAENAAEAAVARAASALGSNPSVSAGGAGAPHTDGAAAAGLAALQQLLCASGGALLQQQEQQQQQQQQGTGLVISIGGVNMIIPAASQLQLAALVGGGGGGAPGVSDAAAVGGHDPGDSHQQHQQQHHHHHQQQQDGVLTLQQQLQLAQLPLGSSGDDLHQQQQQQQNGDGAVAAVPEIDQEALQQQMLQIQQLQQIQLMQLQLAAQQGQLVGVPPGSGGGGGVSGGGPLAHLGLDDDTQTGHMVRRHGVLPERLVTKDMLKQVFNLPIEEAAKQLGIGQTMLKHYCRKFNIPRWPYRKRQSVVQLIQSIQEYTQSPADAQAVEPALQKLRSYLVAIDEDPNVDLDGPIKRLRQAFFKEAYKNRQRLRQEGGADEGRGKRKPDGWLEGLCQAIMDSNPDPSAAQLAAAAAAAALEQQQPNSTELAAVGLQEHDGLADMPDGVADMPAGEGGHVEDEDQDPTGMDAAAAAAGGHGQMDEGGSQFGGMDPQVVAAHLATLQQLQEFQRAGLGCGVQGT